MTRCWRHRLVGYLTHPSTPWGSSGFGGQMCSLRGNLNAVWDADPTEINMVPFFFFNFKKVVREVRQICVGSPCAPVLLWMTTSETPRRSI